MIKTIQFTIVFLLLLCNNKNTIQASPSGSEKQTKTTSNNDQISEVEKAGLSFYKWYLSAINNDDVTIPFEVTIIENEKGMCKLDSEPYFNELKKLGTISEKFIESERQRNSMCEDYVKTVHYKVYESGDAYSFNGFCPQFEYLYWISSQDTYQDVKAIRTHINNDGLSAYVDVAFIYSDFGVAPVISKDRNAKVSLELEQGKWKIVKIELFDENGQILTYSQEYDNIIDYDNKNTIFGSWSNEEVAITISKKTIAFKYHGQCVYFYPTQVVNNKEVILIWSNDMDCKFDNGTSQTFGLKKHPVLGKPFAKYTMEAGVLYTEYFYEEWVEKYRENVDRQTFTDLYFYGGNDSN